MKGDSVITDRDLAASVFTPYNFFKHKFVDERREASADDTAFQNFGYKQKGEAKKSGKLQWNVMTPDAR